MADILKIIITTIMVSTMLALPVQGADFDFDSQKFNFYKDKIKTATRLSIEKERIKKITELKERLSTEGTSSQANYRLDVAQIASDALSAIKNNRSDDCWNLMPTKVLTEYIREHCGPYFTENICNDAYTKAKIMNAQVIHTQQLGVQAALGARKRLMCYLDEARKSNANCVENLNMRIGSPQCLKIYDYVFNDTMIATIANSCTLESIDDFMAQFAYEITGMGTPGQSFDNARQQYALSRKETIEMAKKYSILTNYITQSLNTRAPSSVQCPH